MTREALLQGQLLCGTFLEAKKDGLSPVCHPTELLRKVIEFLWAKVSKFPTHINLGLGIEKWEFLGIPEVMLFCIFHNFLYFLNK